MTHCHREFFHQQWKIILDDDFIEVWQHGIMILCCNGIKRRFYPRIFTYSADYPEKWVRWLNLRGFAYWYMIRILIAGIRNLGVCPCPQCLIPKSRVHNIGTATDMHQRKSLLRVDNSHRRDKIIVARRVIYEKQYQVNSKAVEWMLQTESWVPNVVCISWDDNSFLLTTCHSRTHSLTDCHHLVLTCTGCWFQIWCMNSN